MVLNVLFQYKTPDFITNVNDLATKDYLSNPFEFSIIFDDAGVVPNLFYCSLEGVKRREGGDFSFQRYEPIFLWGEGLWRYQGSCWVLPHTIWFWGCFNLFYCGLQGVKRGGGSAPRFRRYVTYDATHRHSPATKIVSYLLSRESPPSHLFTPSKL